MATTIKQFAKTIAKMVRSDRYVLAVASGYMGEGKSCFLSQLMREVASITNTPFNYNNNITYSRKELKEWIDGGPKGENRKQEQSSILADELINMFFKRSWFDSEQIDGIQLLNKCRDRHLFIGGCVPTFWDLDAGIYSPTTFWCHVVERGRVWIFEKDPNPWGRDPWYRKYNEKVFQSSRSPYKAKGFVCEIMFGDWSPQDKEEYYAVRNAKRVATERRKKKDPYPKLTMQRNILIRLVLDKVPGMKIDNLTELIQLSKRQVERIKSMTTAT